MPKRYKKKKKKKKKYTFNFLLAGNENEIIDKEFLEFDRVIFGKVKNVTDKERYSSSFEIPNETNLEKKIKVESEFHELTNGGHRLLIKKNSKIDEDYLLKLISEMYDSEIGFAKIV